MGHHVVLDATVRQVFGPRLFTLDEPNFGETNGDLLVFVPSALAAGIREKDHVRVTGTVKKFVPSDFRDTWGWLSIDDETGRRYATQPVLVADTIGSNDREIVVLNAATARPHTSPGEIPPSPVATAGPRGDRTEVTLTDPARVVTATDAAVGRRVALADVPVSSLERGGGFIVDAGAGELFVLPGPASGPPPAIGHRVNVAGVLLRLPRQTRSVLTGPARMNREVYLFATSVQRQNVTDQAHRSTP